MATFVLVHGAIVGGWCWRWVATTLRGAGHDVYTPTMTGLGERVHLATPDVDLDIHIEDIPNVLRFEDLTEVVLVGWSCGGMVVAGVADRARRLPRCRCPKRRRHESPSEPPRRPQGTGACLRRLARPARHRREHDSPVDAWATWMELPADMRSWIAERIVPHPLRTWTQPIHLTGVASAIPTTYIRCTIGYDPTDEDTQRQGTRIRSEPTWRYRELAESHLCPWRAPSADVDLLLGLL